MYKYVIIDHKSFPGRMEQWYEQSLRYAPQLDLYQKSVEKGHSTYCAGKNDSYAFFGGHYDKRTKIESLQTIMAFIQVSRLNFLKQ